MASTDDTRRLDTGTEQLLCVIRQGVAVITLNRPDAKNALSDELTPALRTSLGVCDGDDGVGAILITGAGTAFCAGGDVKSMGSGRAGPARSRDERVSELARRQRTLTGVIVASRKPTLAALPGPAAGAGLAIALACDLRIAARSDFIQSGYARIALPGVYGISWLLSRAVGPARARELLLLSERVDAERCERLGLFNRLAADEDLAEEAFALAARLAGGPRGTLAAMKDNLDDALALDLLSAMDREAERLIDAAATDDHREAVRAFVERRPPRFGRVSAPPPQD